MNQMPEAPSPATEPPPPDPGQEDLLGRRSSAALIDVALLAGVFLIFSLTVGDAGLGAGRVYAYLNGTWFLVYLAVVLVYYFVLEATVGQTVGKRLLGLRVVRADGSRLDRMLIFGQRQLEAVLASYVAHDNDHRPHRALGQASPLTAVPPTPSTGDIRVVRVDRLGGLIHEYAQVA